MKSDQSTMPAALMARTLRDTADAIELEYVGRLHWNGWRYESTLEELRQLYERGKDAQWNASHDVAWASAPGENDSLSDPNRSVISLLCRGRGASEATRRRAARDEVVYTLSQLLHGEQAALQLCGQLVGACPSTDEKLFAANQVCDEARHLEVLARLLGEHLGGIEPIAPPLKLILDELLTVEGYQLKVLGMQVIFEGVAMGIFHALGRIVEHPLLADVLRRVQLDEARHAAYGVLMMRRALVNASTECREVMEDWCLHILEGVLAQQQGSLLRALGPRYDIDPERTLKAMQAMPAWRAESTVAFRHMVVPNLCRLGLVTERTAPRWQSLGLLSAGPA